MIFSSQETIGSSLRISKKYLEGYFKEGIARFYARLLSCFVFHITLEELLIESDKKVSLEELDKLHKYLKKTSSGYPVFYILGKAPFFDLEFFVGEGVLIPRPETEILVSKGLEFLNSSNFEEKEVSICDLGSGTGCIGLSLLFHFKKGACVCVEKSPQAFAYLEKNIEHLKLDKKANPVLSSVETWSKTEKNRFHLAVANPPYIAHYDPDVEDSVRQFEPSGALWSEKQGLKELEVWSHLAGKNLLLPGGCLILEFGYGQRPQLEKILSSQKLWSDISFHHDLRGIERVATCLKSF